MHSVLCCSLAGSMNQNQFLIGCVYKGLLAAAAGGLFVLSLIHPIVDLPNGVS